MGHEMNPPVPSVHTATPALAVQRLPVFVAALWWGSLTTIGALVATIVPGFSHTIDSPYSVSHSTLALPLPPLP